MTAEIFLDNMGNWGNWDEWDEWEKREKWEKFQCPLGTAHRPLGDFCFEIFPS